MKLAIVSASVTRRSGGIRDSLLGFTRELVQMPDTAACVLTLDERDAESDFQRWAGVELERFGVRGIERLGYAPGLVGGLVAAEPDLAHTHAIWMYPSAAVASWHDRTRRPYIVSPHGMLDPWAVRNSPVKKRIAYWLYERRHLERARCFHALCESEAQAIRAFGLRAPIAVIPNGIDLPDLANGKDLSRGMEAGGRKVLLYVGRIHPKKGLANLLKAWRQMADTLRDWVLVIVGWDQGGHEEQLMRLATELGIPWRAIDRSNDPEASAMRIPSEASLAFAGPRFDAAKARCYAACDAFVLPSFSEGLPMAVLEAWAHGKPVLITPECNLPEGYFAGAAIEIATDAGRISEGLRAMAAMPDADRRAMGQRGWRLVRDRYTWPVVARQMHDVYAWLVSGAPRPDTVQA